MGMKEADKNEFDVIVDNFEADFEVLVQNALYKFQELKMRNCSHIGRFVKVSLNEAIEQVVERYRLAEAGEDITTVNKEDQI